MGLLSYRSTLPDFELLIDLLFFFIIRHLELSLNFIQNKKTLACLYLNIILCI